ncbi:MAG TPA: hypothetical protein VNU97_09225 [Rhizomicrobium sp.]|jgi:hypothetical protein|nr:hypothetical protein [Rhizomicrobium sp.]
MTTDRSAPYLSPVVAAAASRRARHTLCGKKGQKTRNNYLAESDLSHGNGLENAKRPGAPGGNRNAFKHGRHSAWRLAFRRYRKELVRDTYVLLTALKAHRRTVRP